jgi:hypothetical protein
MAGTTGIPQIDALTVNNLATESLRKLLWLEGYKYGALKDILTMEFGVKNGEHVAWHGDMKPVGLPSTGCTPEWQNSMITAGEKKWILGEYQIAEQLCYKDLDNTIAQWCRNEGTRKADLTDTDYMELIVEPTLKKAMQEMIWRLLWMGDLDADNIAKGGVVSAGINPSLFKTCDGLFKRLYALTASNVAKRVTIAANAETTVAAQRTAIETAGVARKIFDDVIDDAPIMLTQKSGKVLLTTMALAQALRKDIRRSEHYGDDAWATIFSGYPNVMSLDYNGHKVIALPEWDKMIQTFENTGTKYNNPYRVVYAGKDSLLAGFESSDELPELTTTGSINQLIN